jgi:hypothetical protein
VILWRYRRYRETRIFFSKFKNFQKFQFSKIVVPEMLTIDRGEAEVNSQGRGDNKLAIHEYSL